jgi:hypothetical protein
MTPVRNRSRPFSLVVALLAIGMLAAVGFRVGQSARNTTADAAGTWQTAAAAAYSPARARAYGIAWHTGYKRGWRSGVAAGAAAGAKAGQAAGRTAAAAAAVVANEVAAALAATPVKLKPGTKTERCIELPGGLCETLGPRVTGKRCPPGSRADPEGGVVCVPEVLVLAARMAHATSAKLFSP